MVDTLMPFSAMNTRTRRDGTIVEFHDVLPEGLTGRLRPAAFQHTSNAQVFVEVGPVYAHRHDLIICALLGRRVAQMWIPFHRRCDLPAVSECDDKIGRSEFDRARTQITDVDFQSAHFW